MQVVSFTLNGKPTSLTVDETRPLLWVLRDDLGLTGSKFGCGEGSLRRLHRDRGQQGRSLVRDRVGDVQGKHVLTIEGVAKDGRLHPIQQAFVEHVGVPVRLLHARHDHGRLRDAAPEPEGHARRHRQGARLPPLPVRGARAHRERRRSRRRGDERGRAMKPIDTDFDRDQELVVDGPTTFPVDRREFVKLTATGLLVLVAVDPLGARQETAALADGAPGLSDRRQRLPAHRRRRQGDLPGRQDRDGPGRDDVAAAVARRGTRCGARVGGHRDGRHRPVPVGHGDVRVAQRPAVRPDHAAGGRRRARDAAADGVRAPAGAGGPAQGEGGRRQRRERPEEDGDLRAVDRRASGSSARRTGRRRSSRSPRTRSSASRPGGATAPTR